MHDVHTLALGELRHQTPYKKKIRLSPFAVLVCEWQTLSAECFDVMWPDHCIRLDA